MGLRDWQLRSAYDRPQEPRLHHHVLLRRTISGFRRMRQSRSTLGHCSRAFARRFLSPHWHDHVARLLARQQRACVRFKR